MYPSGMSEVGVATGINANGYGMMNDDNVALFWDNEERCGSIRGQTEELGFCETLGFWSSKTPFTRDC